MQARNEFQKELKQNIINRLSKFLIQENKNEIVGIS